MTAPPDGRPPATEAETEADQAGHPDRGQADDGKRGGQSTGNPPGETAAYHGDGAGTNAQSGKDSGSEVERDAPGMSTDKKADDTK